MSRLKEYSFENDHMVYDYLILNYIVAINKHSEMLILFVIIDINYFVLKYLVAIN
jgi:hypothetical protein